MRALFAVLFLAALAGCATTDPRLADLATTAPPQAREFTLPETLSVPTRAEELNFLRRGLRVYALAGKYVAYKWNAHGTLYQGERPVIWEVIDTLEATGKNWVYRGGIWVPSAPGAAPRLFIFPNTPMMVKDGTLVAAENVPGYEMASAEKDNSVTGLVAGVVGRTNTAPLQAGAAGAIAGGLVAALASMDVDPEFVGSEIVDPALTERIRAAATAASKNN